MVASTRVNAAKAKMAEIVFASPTDVALIKGIIDEDYK
jgi:hypothetical protein